MKVLVKTLVFILMVACFSCEEKGWFTDCSGCWPNEPEMVDLIINISHSVNDVIVNIYEGELEDSILYASLTPMVTEYRYQVTLNKKYSITATYYIEGNKYIAVDSAVPRTRFTEDQCDDPCYFVYDRVVDLRLKYTAKD